MRSMDNPAGPEPLVRTAVCCTSVTKIGDRLAMPDHEIIGKHPAGYPVKLVSTIVADDKSNSSFSRH
jgi:hypothetical protein